MPLSNFDMFCGQVFSWGMVFHNHISNFYLSMKTDVVSIYHNHIGIFFCFQKAVVLFRISLLWKF